MLHKTLIAFVATAAFACVPVATNALAAGPAHSHAGHSVAAHAARGGHVARYRGGYPTGGPVYNGPIYDSCAGYGYGPGYGADYGGCPGYGVPLVGGVIDGVVGGYAPY